MLLPDENTWFRWFWAVMTSFRGYENMVLLVMGSNCFELFHGYEYTDLMIIVGYDSFEHF